MEFHKYANKFKKNQKLKEKIEYNSRIRKLVKADLKWQEYFNHIEKIFEKIKTITPIFFNFGEAGFYYKISVDLELIFHLRFDDKIFEYVLFYQGEPEEFGESSYNQTVQADIEYIKGIINLFSQ